MIQYAEDACGVFSTALFEPDECDSIVHSLKNIDHWINAQVRREITNGEYDSVIKPDVRSASILKSAHAPGIVRAFDEKLNTVIKPLVKEIWSVNLSEHSGTQILRYAPGGHYLPHRDSGLDLEDRYFTVLCYLNEDFEGGTTWFPSLSYSTVPKCGKAILFPSKYFHCAHPVISGEKYVMVSWILGPVPIKWI
jgi:hypothetical protein